MREDKITICSGMFSGCVLTSSPQGAVKVYPLPDDGSPMPDRIFSHIPSSAPVECVVRVYIVKVSE